MIQQKDSVFAYYANTYTKNKNLFENDSCDDKYNCDDVIGK